MPFAGCCFLPLLVLVLVLSSLPPPAAVVVGLRGLTVVLPTTPFLVLVAGVSDRDLPVVAAAASVVRAREGGFYIHSARCAPRQFVLAKKRLLSAEDNPPTVCVLPIFGVWGRSGLGTSRRMHVRTSSTAVPFLFLSAVA